MAKYNQVGYGSKGSDVTELQKLLNDNGYDLEVDGVFGDKTQAAVKDYQKNNNLAVDGIVGDNTWGALTAPAQTTTATTPAATTTQVATTPTVTTPTTSSTQPTQQLRQPALHPKPKARRSTSLRASPMMSTRKAMQF